MAILTPAAFFSKWTSRFADNSTRDISESDMREFAEDLKDSFQSILGGTVITSWKDPVVVATTGNIVLSGEQTIDGVLTSADRVLVRAQSTASQNGIYVSDAGAWTRSTDADAASELEGAAVGVTQGSTYANTVWLQTADSITLGVTSITWQQIGFGVSSQNLSQVLTQGNDGGGIEIENIADPASAQSAATRAWVEDLISGELQTAEIDISSAEILSSNSVPIPIIAAPGSNKIVRVIEVALKYTFVSAAYATNTNIVFIYDGLVVGAVQSQPSLVIAQTNDRFFITDGIAGVSQGYNALDNQGVVLYTTTGDPTAGSGTLKCFVTYKIVDFS